MEKALEHLNKAWDTIKSGDFFDEKANATFEYMLKTVWRTPYGGPIKQDIIKHLPFLFAKAKGMENPPPFMYILISLKDDDILKELQVLSISEWIKANSSEETTYQILNMLETFNDKQISLAKFVETVIKHMNTRMDKDMLQALAYMISTQHPEFLGKFLKKFLDMKDDLLLKDFINMTGKKSLLMLTQMADPVQLNRILKVMGR